MIPLTANYMNYINKNATILNITTTPNNYSQIHYKLSLIFHLANVHQYDILKSYELFNRNYSNEKWTKIEGKFLVSILCFWHSYFVELCVKIAVRLSQFETLNDKAKKTYEIF